jgi:predicted porin
MKKVLYGTTAIVAAGALLSSPASAADPIKLGVGGYYQTFVSFVDQDDCQGDFDSAACAGQDFHSINVRQEGEIHFKGSTTLDNGLEIAFQAQLEAVAQGDQVDEQYVTLSGGWGQLDIGAENSAPYKMGYQAPSVGLGVNSPNFFLFSPAGTQRTSSLTTAVSDANKLTYYTPRFGGFQLGVSYTPNTDATAGDRQTFGLNTDDDPGDNANWFSIGANFSQSFSGIDVAVSGGYERGDLEEDGFVTLTNVTGSTTVVTADDHESWNIGLNVGFSGFTVGGSYYQSNNGIDVSGVDTDAIVWDVGASYGTGPWGVSVTYLNSEQELGSFEDEHDHIELGASYSLGAGITAVASVQFFDESLDSAEDSDGTAFAAGLKMSF